MAENNNNQNTQSQEGQTNSNQSQNQNQNTQQSQSTQNNAGNNNQNQNIDVEAEKKKAVEEYIKSLGLENSESLSSIVQAHNEKLESEKTDLEKKDDELTKALQQLNEEKKARIMAEAKNFALTLKAKPSLLDDLIIVATAKVTKEKDIQAVITEMKDSENGKVYFEDEEEEAEKNKNVTRKAINNNQSNNQNSQNNSQNNDKNNNSGTMAERLFNNRQKVKNHYFGRK